MSSEKRTLIVLAASLELLITAMAYSRVSLNNGQARAAGSFKDVAFTVSPNVYVVTPRTVELRPGEAVDHPSTSTRYSTLDQERVAQLDALVNRQRVQDRFVPHSAIDAHAHALRQQQSSSKKPADASPLASSPTNKEVVYTKPLVSMTFDYPPGPTSYEGKPGKPVDDLPLYPPLKQPDDSYPSTNPIPETPTFNFDEPPKSIEFPGHYDSPFQDVPSYAGPYTHGDIIYDDHDFHHHLHHQHHHRPRPMATEEPETMDQRVNEHYSYYHIGRKLWYVPLYFSIYFIIYIAALVLRSIARHKINFPANLAAAAEGANARSRQVASPDWRDYVVGVLDAVEKYGSVVFRD